MKKLLQSGKLWTGLFILVFIMTCGLLIYAASSRDFTSFKTTTMGNTLTSQNWNNLMDSLNEYTVPQGAVMAFNLEKCPDGWAEYTAARNRFIRGKSSTVGLGEAGGRDTVTLSINNLPKHSHEIYLARKQWGDNAKDRTISILDGTTYTQVDSKYQATDWQGYFQDVAATQRTAYAGQGSPDSINVLNPYVYLLYCYKI